MLRKIRVTLAVVCFTLITLLFLDFTGTLHAWFGWLAKIQFLPAVLALNVGVIVALLALTLLSGRVYCSVICPLGVFQDAISWISGKRKKKKYRWLVQRRCQRLRGPQRDSAHHAGERPYPGYHARTAPYRDRVLRQQPLLPVGAQGPDTGGCEPKRLDSQQDRI